jgi:pimeloyl-ACP methyl ester carboxylesterase
MYLEAWSRPGALTGGLNYYRALAFEPPAAGQPLDEARARQVKAMDPAPFMVRVPTLVIWGERDTALTVHNLNGLERYVPDLSIRRIADGSHWVVGEEPLMINSLIRDFIRTRP